MITNQIAFAPQNKQVRIEGPGIPAMTFKGDGNLQETRDRLQSLPQDAVIMSLEDKRFMSALRSFGQNGTAPRRPSSWARLAAHHGQRSARHVRPQGCR